MRIAVLGASGFIGRRLCAALRARGDDVTEVSLRDPAAAATQSRNAEAIVNLAGEPIAQRWTDDVKQRIRSSRVDLPLAFLQELSGAGARPHTYLSSSAIGYYGTSLDETFTESSSPGNDFLARVCVDWEAAAQTATSLGARVAIVHNGLVLAADGGALERILPPFRAGAGGRVGSGKQWYSWVHVDDTIGIYLHALGHPEGVFNAAAPNPVRNSEFTKELASAVHRPAFLPAPMFAIKAMLGEGAYVVTEGQRVLPERTLADGYSFRYTMLRAALTEILSA
jgi:uncharacterized protein